MGMICLRVDDYPSAKPAEFVRHNFGSFMDFHQNLRKVTGASYLLGVIPRNTSDEELVELARPERKIVVGMHGLSHDESFQNEFRDYMTDREVGNLLSCGRDRLRQATGQLVDVYLPPHNFLDDRTPRLLKRAGFAACTTGPGTTEQSFRALRTAGVRYINSDAPLEYGRSDELLERGSVRHLIDAAQILDEVVFLTLHWTWEHNIGLTSMLKYLEKIEWKIGDFDHIHGT